MRIIVCVKQVPGTSKVEIDEETGSLKREGVDAKLNPYDLYALEVAARLKESNGAEITALSMGPPQAAEAVREAYMMGVDKGVLLSDRGFAGSDVLATSYALSQGVTKLGVPDLIICGKMTTDGDTAQVGPEIAEFLGIPHVANVTKIHEVRDDAIVVDMDLPYAVEKAEVKFPCLITVDKTICQPRLPSFKLKMATKDREIPMVSLEELKDQDKNHYGLNGSPTQVLRIFPPPSNEDHEIWEDDNATLAEKLYGKLTAMKFA